MGEHGRIAIVERFIRSMKSECTRRVIVPFGMTAMRSELASWATWYHAERAHQGIGNVTIENVDVGAGEIECRERLGGILKHYTRAA